MDSNLLARDDQVGVQALACSFHDSLKAELQRAELQDEQMQACAVPRDRLVREDARSAEIIKPLLTLADQLHQWELECVRAGREQFEFGPDADRLVDWLPLPAETFVSRCAKLRWSPAFRLTTGEQQAKAWTPTSRGQPTKATAAVSSLHRTRQPQTIEPLEFRLEFRL